MTKEEKAMPAGRRVKEILRRLYKIWPNPKIALNYSNPLELLIATILSAQTTDKLVNSVTPELFKKFKFAKDYSKASLEEINSYIKKVNFHNNKSKSIKATSEIIYKKYNGIVPKTMEELDALPGVARKTANVVLGSGFKITSGIVVDTHVMRLSQKLKLTNEKTPEKIEEDLMKIVPKENWIDFSLLLVNFGREFCKARPHECKNCPLKDLCPDIL